MFKIGTIGRYSPVKRLEVMIKTISQLGPEYQLYIYGPCQTIEEEEYKNKLIRMLIEKEIHNVSIMGPVSPSEIRKTLLTFDCFINCETHSLSKAPLEAMAIGVPTIVNFCGKVTLFESGRMFVKHCHSLNKLVDNIYETFKELNGNR